MKLTAQIIAATQPTMPIMEITKYKACSFGVKA